MEDYCERPHHKPQKLEKQNVMLRAAVASCSEGCGVHLVHVIRSVNVITVYHEHPPQYRGEWRFKRTPASVIACMRKTAFVRSFVRMPTEFYCLLDGQTETE